MDSDADSDDTTTAEQESEAQAQPEPEPEPLPVPKPDEDKMPPKGSKPEQLHSDPGGDAFPQVAKVEGLLDKSDETMA